MTSREFNQDTAGAKRSTDDGPVIITVRGEPSHVLISYEEWQRLKGGRRSLLDAVAGWSTAAADIDIDFEADRYDEHGRKKVDEPRPLDLD